MILWNPKHRRPMQTTLCQKPNLNLPHGGERWRATLKGRKRDADGRPIRKQHPKPLLDTRLYEVEFPDGSTKAITANLIAETPWSQVDNEG